MATRLLLAVTFVCLAWPTAARAQMDDLLAPLTPADQKQDGAKKKAPKSKAAKKRPARTRGEPKETEASSPKQETAPVATRGKLQVSHSPSDKSARLLVNGQDRGELPGPPLELEAGSYAVELRRPGFADFKATVEVPAGETRQLSAQLEPVSAVIEVLSNVDGAEVLVDGRRVGETPLRELLLPAGSYVLVVRKSGYREERSELPVRVGREYSVQATLKPGVNKAAEGDRPLASSLEPSDVGDASSIQLVESGKTGASGDDVQKPLYKRWYFWTAAAAVVAAGVTTYALTRDSGPQLPDSAAVCQGTCATVMFEPQR